MIGLYDWDLLKWRSPVVFNLELMKLATYYKTRERQIIKMIRDIDGDIEAFNKVVIRKDYDDFYYPSHLTTNQRIEWGGLAMTNNIYVPLPPQVEACVPDTSIYQKCGFVYDASPKLRKTFKTMMTAEHYRISNDEIVIKKEDELKSRYLIIHDNDLCFNDEIKRKISALRNNNYKSNIVIGTKYPVDIYNENDFIFWADIKKIADLNCMNIYCKLADSALAVLIKKPQEINFIINDITLNFKDELLHLLLQSNFAACCGCNTKIHVGKESPLSDEWIQFIKFYNRYLLDTKLKHNFLVYSPYRFCKRDKFLSRDEKYALFHFLEKESVDIYDLMFNMEYTKLNNGKIEKHMYTPLEIDKYGGYHDAKRNFGQDSEEQFNYATITEPERVYIKQHDFRTSEREQKITADLW